MSKATKITIWLLGSLLVLFFLTQCAPTRPYDPPRSICEEWK